VRRRERGFVEGLISRVYDRLVGSGDVGYSARLATSDPRLAPGFEI